MAKSNIIKELVNEDITLKKALYRLLLIAADIGDEELSKWIQNELNGYSSKDENIPDYRKVSSLNITYSGINGSFKITNQPLPFNYIPEKIREACFNDLITDSIDSLEKMSAADHDYAKDLTGIAPLVYKESGIQCFSIRANFSNNTCIDILNTIKTRLVMVLLILEKEFGNLDSLDIPSDRLSEEKKLEVQNAIKIIIHDNSVKIGDSNNIEDSNFLIGEDDGN